MSMKEMVKRTGRPVAGSASCRGALAPSWKDRVQLNVKISPEAKDRLIEMRETFGVSMSDWVDELILAAYGREHDAA